MGRGRGSKGGHGQGRAASGGLGAGCDDHREVTGPAIPMSSPAVAE